MQPWHRDEQLVSDVIRLTIPSGDRYRSVVTLVLGGIGNRVELPYERMDDLQLALVSALGACADGELTVEVDAGGDALAIAVGPVERGSGADPALARVLEPLVDAVRTVERGGGEWLELSIEAPRSG